MLATLTMFWDRPWVLVAMVLVILPMWLAHRDAHKGVATSRVSLGLRIAAIALLVLALAGTQLAGLGDGSGPWLVITDISGSTRTQHDTPITFDDNREVDRFNFAAWPSVPGQAIDDTATNIGAALAQAVVQVQRGSEGVVIATDGQFNTGDWVEQAEALRMTGTPVTIVPMATPPIDARILSFSARRTGNDIALTARLYATDDLAIGGAAARERPFVKALDETIYQLPAQQVVTATFADNFPADLGCGVFKFSLQGEDAFPENSSAVVTLPPAEPMILVLAEDPAPWVEAITEITGLRAVPRVFQGCPTNPSYLADFAGVVLIDSTGQALEVLQRDALSQFVHAGGGLVLIGTGPYGTPAAHKDPLNTATALMADPSLRRPMDIVVLLDRSGSMGQVQTDGTVPFDKARQATDGLREYLAPTDALRVIAFADTARTVFDSGDGPIEWDALHEALAPIEPAGGTAAGVALDAATQLPAREGKHRLVLIVSDLDTEPFDADAIATNLIQADASLAIVEIHASEIQVGPTGTPEGILALSQLAERMQSPRITYVATFRVDQLATIFAKFITQTRGEPVRRGEFIATDITLPTVSRAFTLPALTSYLIATPTTDNAVRLGSVGTDPILAARPAGLGRTMTLTVPMEIGQNEAWYRSETFKALLGSMVEWTRKQRPATALTGGVETLPNGQRTVFLHADPDAAALSANDMHMVIVSDGEPVSLPMVPTGPGTFSAALPAGWDGEVVEVRDRHTGDLLFGESLLAGSTEFQHLGPDWHALEALARHTGGVLLKEHQTVLSQEQAPRELVTCWPALMIGAVVAMLIDWLLTGRSRRRRLAAA